MSIKEEIERDLGRPILTAFEQAGITERYLANKLKRELNAKKTEVFKGRKGKGRAEVVIYSKPLIDWETRQKAREDAHKIFGHYPNPKLGVEHSGTVGASIKFEMILDDGNDNLQGKPDPK